MANFLFLLCLLVASFTDFRQRIIPNTIPLCIAILALREFHVLGVLVALPFFVCAMQNPDKVGGGDIKLTAAIGVFLGWNQALTAILLALFTTILLAILSNKKKLSEISVPFAPYLTFGVLLSYYF